MIGFGNNRIFALTLALVIGSGQIALAQIGGWSDEPTTFPHESLMRLLQFSEPADDAENPTIEQELSAPESVVGVPHDDPSWWNEGEQQHDPAIFHFPTFVYTTGQALWTGGWYFQGDALMLLKTKLDEVPLAEELGDVVLTAQTDSPSYEPGMRLTLGKVLGRDVWNRDHMIEFRFLGLFQWQTSAAVVANQTFIDGIDTLLGPPSGDILSLHGDETQGYVFRSNLNNFDLNLRFRTRSSRDRMVLQNNGSWVRHSTPSRIWSGYGGLTYFSIDEQFQIEGSSPDRFGRYTVTTDNDLIGLQVGGQYVEQHAIWNWGVRGRLGGLVNFAHRNSRFFSNFQGNVTVRHENIEQNNMVFMTEGGLFASLQYHPNASLQIGYDMLYLTGLTLAPDNLGLPVGVFSPLDAGGDALYHGAFLRYERVW